jgi:hypothetical protein
LVVHGHAARGAATTGVSAVSVGVVGVCGKAGEGAHQAVGEQGLEDAWRG